LGFKEGPKGTETPYDQLSRRNSIHSDYSFSSHSNNNEFPMDIIWGESLTSNSADESSSSSSSSSSGSNNKSSNNKKKKKKKRRH
jgi:hypothetical protein